MLCHLTSPGGTAEIRGRITNSFTAEEYRAVSIIITDRLGVEIGRTSPDESGRFQIKVSGPRYIVIKAILEGYPTRRSFNSTLRSTAKAPRTGKRTGSLVR